MSRVAKNVVIASYKRTPFGTFGGSLADLSATDLAVEASQAAITTAKLDPNQIDSVFFGNVCQSSSDAIYLARHVGLKCAIPVDRPAVTVNRLCGSGFESIAQAARQIQLDEIKCALAGGSESMSQIPYVLRKARFGVRLGHSEVEDYLTASLYDSYAKMPMAMTAERVGKKYEVARSHADDYALLSQKRYEAAKQAGHFADEIIAIQLQLKNQAVTVQADEHPRPQSTIEGLAKLKPLFKADGLVTAGNASGMCDGAAAVIVAEEEWARANDLPILGRLLAWSQVGCQPEEMGLGPVMAIRRIEEIMKERGQKISLADCRLIEVNEAFAAQYLGVERELGLDREKTNSQGGAIAIGHPLGASGTRLTGQLLNNLRRSGGGLGIASACIGGGQGMALLLEVT